MEEAICSSHAGDALELEFTGRCIGLYHIASRDAGIALITIDDNAPFEVDFYKNMDVPYCLMKKINLENEKHKMIVKVSEKRNTNSIGNFIRIGYFLME